jgi:hypothetical protein
MGPDDKADGADGHHRIGHSEIAEDRLFREGRNDVADNAEARQDHDIHFRMTKEPEQVLVKQQVTTIGRIKEGGAEVTVRQQHGDRAGQNRKRQQQQKGCDQHGPCEQRHFVQGHSGGPHIQDRRNKIDGAED